MIQKILDLMIDPTIASAIFELALSLIALVLAVVLPIAVRIFNKLSFIKIEEKHAKAIDSGIRTWAENALRRGVTEANRSSIESLEAYLNATYPDAMRFLKPTVTGLQGIANRYLGSKKD